MSETLFEEIAVYGLVGLVCLLVVFLISGSRKRNSAVVEGKKLRKQKKKVCTNRYHCIRMSIIIAAYRPEPVLQPVLKRISFGIKDGKATIINVSRCIGYGACFHARPTSLPPRIDFRKGESTHVDPDLRPIFPDYIY
ncbi:MAG: hypothetical protein U0T82_16025 [Bacteroidales bacterium]